MRRGSIWVSGLAGSRAARMLGAVALVLMCAIRMEATASDEAARGPASDASSVQAITNDMCPVMPDELTDPDIWVEYKGKRVYFCCQKCKRMFERDPEKYVVNLVGFDQGPASEGASGGATKGAGASSGDEQRVAAPSAGSAPNPADAGAPTTSESASKGAAVPAKASDASETEAGPRLPHLLVWLGKFHPAAVNFPIGLLVSGALAELLLMVTKRATYASAARYCVWIGALGALAGASLGWLYGGLQFMRDDWLLATHRWLGTLTAATALVALALSESHHRYPERLGRRHRYRVALFLSAVLVSGAGFFGGAMALGLTHYAW